MSIGGLQWSTKTWPFGVGLNQATDKRSRPEPALDIAIDVQADDQGGLQTRLPYAPAMSSIFGGGSLSTARRIAVVGDELLCFTKDTLYTWSARDSAWVSRGTHLAVKVDERPRFVTTGDQIDGDRAELSNTVVYAWVDGTTIYVAAIDKTTEAIIAGPTSLAGTRPRLVALTTKILLFFKDSSDNLQVTALDPADVNTGVIASPTLVLAAASFNSYYDVVKIPSADQAIGACRRQVTTSHEIFKVTAGLSVTNSTKARTCDGPIAVSCDPTGATAQIIRANTTNIQGDRLTVSTLADAATGQAVGTAAGTPVNQIAAAHRSVQNSGAYRCYAFWSSQEDVGSTVFFTKFNFVDTGGTIGTQANFVPQMGVVSRAFDHDGQVYVWLAFAKESEAAGGTPAETVRSQAQNTYFLYRDDQRFTAKAVWQVAGGYAASTGRLPGVALVEGTTGYAWCGTERRRLELGHVGHFGYGDRGPRDILFTFDSDEARRCVRLGRTLYVSGGEILQYDGVGLFELGFHIYPWFLAAVPTGAGDVPDGDYVYKATYRWQNGRGEQERSTTATSEAITVTGGPREIVFGGGISPLNVTHKTSTNRVPAVELWRTKVDPPDEAPFFLVTSPDPSVLAGDNRYIANSHTATTSTTGDDNFDDTELGAKEANPENGGLLENLAPPAATLLAANDSRLFLAGVAGDPDRVWYSKTRQDGELAAFHEILTFQVPRPGGAITAIAAREDAVIVWRETATYVFPGVGFDNFGQGQNNGVGVATVSEDVGAVNAESVARTDKGYVFKSDKGWQLLAGLSVTYIGGPVADYDDEDVYAVTVVEAQHHVRVLTGGRMLVLDTTSGQWFEWSVGDGRDACMWQGQHVYLTSAGPRKQSTTYTGLTYGLDVETSWIKLADLQGAAAVRRILVLGEMRSEHYLRVRIAYDYKYSDAPPVPTYVDDKAWHGSMSGISAGAPLQVKHAPRRPRCQAIKIRLSALAGGTFATAGLGLPVPLLGGGDWTATFSGVFTRSLSIGFVYADLGADNIIDVRDNMHWEADAEEWSSSPGTCGVRIVGGGGADILVSELEAAISTRSQLITLVTPHVGIDGIDVQAMDGMNTGGSFEEAYPTGEALSLTGLGLEVGADPGLFRNLPPARQQ